MKFRAIVLAIGLLSVAGCDDVADPDGGGPGSDASASLACTHFRNVAADYSEGLLTVPELRTKLQEVHSDASVSTNPGIAEGARDMLAAITRQDLDAFNPAVRRFGDACRAVGE